MNVFILPLFLLLAVATSAARETFTLTLEVYRLPLRDRIAIGDVSTPELLAGLKSKSAKLIHRGTLSTPAGTRCRYEDGTKVSVLDDWQRDKSGKLAPVFTEVLVGVTAQFEIYLADDGRMASIEYEIEHIPKPPRSLRGGVTIKDNDSVMEFDYETSAFPRMKAIGAFFAVPNGSRILFETADDMIATIMILRYATQRE
jgi:hypothetical protein